MKYKKRFISCNKPFSDNDCIACPYIKAISPEYGLENGFPFDEMWGCFSCDGWSLSEEWSEEDEKEENINNE